jgi:hypothetical protein
LWLFGWVLSMNTITKWYQKNPLQHGTKALIMGATLHILLGIFSLFLLIAFAITTEEWNF